MIYQPAPKKEGFHLNEEGDEAYSDWIDRYGDRGCTCFLSPPCSSCTHEGHPISVEETAEFWEKDAVDIMAVTKEFLGK